MLDISIRNKITAIKVHSLLNGREKTFLHFALRFGNFSNSSVTLVVYWMGSTTPNQQLHDLLRIKVLIEVVFLYFTCLAFKEVNVSPWDFQFVLIIWKDNSKDKSILWYFAVSVVVYVMEKLASSKILRTYLTIWRWRQQFPSKLRQIPIDTAFYAVDFKFRNVVWNPTPNKDRFP
jgi:hypothetical protein